MVFDVVTFGSAVVDIFVDTDLNEKGRFMCYPLGAKILLENLRFDIGGGGTNTAVAFSRLGLKTGYIGKIGDDTDGKEIIGVLKKEKIKFLGKQEKGIISGYSIILDSAENNRTILTYKGLNDFVDFKDIKRFKTKWIYYSSLLGKSLGTQIKLAKKLCKKGTKLAFNPSDYLIKKKPGQVRELLKLAEIVVLNKQEARLLTKQKDLLIGLSELGPKIVVVTDKNKKILAYNSKNNKKYSLIPNKIKVIERTGAGDAFAAGFVAGQIVNKSMEFSLKLGLRESESVIRHFGAKNNLIKKKLKNK